MIIAEKFKIKYDFTEKFFSILDNEIKKINYDIKKKTNSHILIWQNEKDPKKKQNILIDFIFKQNMIF